MIFRRRHRPVIGGISIGREGRASLATLGVAVYKDNSPGYVITVKHATEKSIMTQPGYELDEIDDGVPSATGVGGEPIATHVDTYTSIALYRLEPGVVGQVGTVLTLNVAVVDYVKAPEYETLARETKLVMFGRTSGRVEGKVAMTPSTTGALRIQPRNVTNSPLTRPGDSGAPWILDEPGRPKKLVALHNHRQGDSWGVPVHQAFELFNLSL
jgi:hypothetical protein